MYLRQVVTCKSMQQRFIFFLNNLLIGEMDSADQALHASLHVLPDAEFSKSYLSTLAYEV